MGLRVLVVASIVTGLSITAAEARRGFSLKGLSLGGSAKAAPAPAAIPRPVTAPTAAVKPPPAPAAAAAPAPVATPAATAPVTQSRSLVIVSGRPRQTSGETDEQRQRRETLPVSTSQAGRETINTDAIVQPASFRTDGAAAAPKGFKTLN